MLTMAPPRPRDEPPDLGPPPAPGRFTEAFSIVPGKMAEGGTTAGGTIARAMIGAAGEAGSIIAGRIQAAAANITVNVKATGEGPDTGSLKASHNAG